MPEVPNTIESTVWPDPKPIFLKLTAEQALHQLYQYQLEFAVKEATPKTAADVIWKEIKAKVTYGEGKSQYFSGVVTEFLQLGLFRGYWIYRAVVRPQAWILTRNRNFRMFQEKSISDIVGELFQSPLTSPTGLSTTTRDYCCQYGESEFNFFSRLLEEEGYYYYFDKSGDQEELKVTNAGSVHQNIGEFKFRRGGDAKVEADTFTSWQPSFRSVIKESIYTDYDFTAPDADLLRTKTSGTTNDTRKGSYFHYPGRYGNSNATLGETFVESRQMSSEMPADAFEGAGELHGFYPGVKFDLVQHPAHDGEYLATHVNVDIESAHSEFGGENRFETQVRAIKSSARFYPEIRSERPLVVGPQSAKVVGKAGEEIWTDKYGRVKVQFTWDREAQGDENSSCFLRVVQPWAGNKWGAQFLPRIGHEVLVEFLNGDPDRPIVTGCVYNENNSVPYALPDHQTQSGIKTRSSKEGTEDNFNELRFEDKKGEEEVYLQAEKDFNTVVKNNQTVTVGNDEAEDGSQTVTVYKNRTVTIETGDESLTVSKGKRTVTISEGDESLTVSKGKRDVTVSEGNSSLTVSKGNYNVAVSKGDCVVEAGNSIELKVGSNSIKIETSGITISGSEIEVNASGTLTLKGATVNIN